MLGQGAGCRGSKLIAVTANGSPAFAAYKPDPESGDWLPWSLTVLEPVAGEEAGPAVAGVRGRAKRPGSRPASGSRAPTSTPTTRPCASAASTWTPR